MKLSSNSWYSENICYPDQLPIQPDDLQETLYTFAKVSEHVFDPLFVGPPPAHTKHVATLQHMRSALLAESCVLIV